MQVPKEVEPDAVDAGDVIGDARHVRNLVPGDEERGTDCAPGCESRVVGQPSGDGEPGGTGAIGVAGAVGDPAKSGAEVDVEPIARAVADEHGLTAHGPGPRAYGIAGVGAADVRVEVHEHLEAVGEAVADAEVKIGGAQAHGPFVGKIKRAAAQTEGEEESLARLRLIAAAG